MFGQSGRQRACDIRKPACFHKWDTFRGEHGGGVVTATGLGVGGKDGVGIREPNLLLSEALCGPV